MASQSHGPSASSCPEKTQMFGELQAAMTAMMALHNREMAAVIAGDTASLEAISAELQTARERKDALMFAYKSHVQDHGC